MSIVETLLKAYVRVVMKLTKQLLAEPRILFAFVGVIVSMATAILVINDKSGLDFESIVPPLSFAVVMLTIGIYLTTRAEYARNVKRLKSKPVVFVSYHHDDAEFVTKLNEDLISQGVDVVVDRANLQVGDNIRKKLSQLIAESDFFIYVVSESSSNSKWLQVELEQARRQRKRVLPIVIRGGEMPEELGDIVYADFEKSYESGLRRILEAINLLRGGLKK